MTVKGWRPWDSPFGESEEKPGTKTRRDHQVEQFKRRVRRTVSRLEKLEPATEEKPDPGLLTVDDVANLSGCSKWAVVRAIAKGELPVAVRGKRGRGCKHLLRPEDVEAWLER